MCCFSCFVRIGPVMKRSRKITRNAILFCALTMIHVGVHAISYVCSFFFSLYVRCFRTLLMLMHLVLFYFCYFWLRYILVVLLLLVYCLCCWCCFDFVFFLGMDQIPALMKQLCSCYVNCWMLYCNSWVYCYYYSSGVHSILYASSVLLCKILVFTDSDVITVRHRVRMGLIRFIVNTTTVCVRACVCVCVRVSILVCVWECVFNRERKRVSFVIWQFNIFLISCTHKSMYKDWNGSILVWKVCTDIPARWSNFLRVCLCKYCTHYKNIFRHTVCWITWFNCYV